QPCGRSLCWALVFLGVALGQAAAQTGGEGTKNPDDNAKKAAKAPGMVVVRFVDDSTMRVQLQDERIELETPHGNLLIPVADIHQIEFASRTPEDVAKRAAVLVADLGHKDFKRRQAATDDLAALGERAYPALLTAVRVTDPEAARRARDLLEKVRQAAP